MFRLHDCEIDAIDGSSRERGEHYQLRSLNKYSDETFAEFDITFYATDTSLNYGQLGKSDKRKFQFYANHVSLVEYRQQWRTQEFCSGGGVNKFSWGQRERGSGGR